MLTLYVKTGCPYSAKVLEELKKHDISYAVKNRNSPGVIDELIARGGKRQFPYIVDEEAKVEMYESDDIVEYLNKKFGSKKSEKIKSKNGGAACEV